MTYIIWSSDYVLYLLDYLMENIIVGIMHQYDHQINFSSMCRSVTYILWPSKFASCLEDYLLQESCTWDDRSVSLRADIVNYILPYIIVINFKIFYN